MRKQLKLRTIIIINNNKRNTDIKAELWHGISIRQVSLSKQMYISTNIKIHCSKDLENCEGLHYYMNFKNDRSKQSFASNKLMVNHYTVVLEHLGSSVQ